MSYNTVILFIKLDISLQKYFGFEIFYYLNHKVTLTLSLSVSLRENNEPFLLTNISYLTQEFFLTTLVKKI